MSAPGKFQGCEDEALGERLHQMSLEGGCDEEHGSVDEPNGWNGLIGDAVVNEDSQGFFTYVMFVSAAEARAAWESFLVGEGEVT